MELVAVPAGEFWMGWDDGAPGEGPRHRVRVDAFAIARGPVTNADYAEFLAAVGATPPPWWRHPDFAAPANPLGLVALSGVCHEWCLDWESETYYAASPADNPRGPETGRRRISRGGAWRHQDPWSPVAHRSSLPPHLAHSDYGFRVVVGALVSPSAPS